MAELAIHVGCIKYNFALDFDLLALHILFHAGILSRKNLGSMTMALKPGPKPIAKSTGLPDQRRRDNKTTPGNNPGVKPSASSKSPKK